MTKIIQILYSLIYSLLNLDEKATAKDLAAAQVHKCKSEITSALIGAWIMRSSMDYAKQTIGSQ